MAPSFDSAVSSLLCAEDNIFDDNDFGSEEITWNHHRNRRNHNQNRGFGDEQEDGLPLQSSDEYLTSIVENESHHLPRLDYLKRLQSGDLDLGARNEAVDWIRKANAHFSFGPLCQYLSVNYLDRFLSAYEIPNGKAWTMQLLAVACVLLAAKMEEIDVPLSLDLQVAESKYVFEARTIQRMELLVLSTLRWRMQAVTPFSFIDSFLLKINDDQIPIKASILRSVQLILSTTKGIDFLEYRPSEVAAAVAISVAGESKALDHTEKAITVLMQHVDLEKDRVLQCVNLVQEVGLMSGAFKNNGSGSAHLKHTHTHPEGQKASTMALTLSFSLPTSAKRVPVSSFKRLPSRIPTVAKAVEVFPSKRIDHKRAIRIRPCSASDDSTAAVVDTTTVSRNDFPTDFKFGCATSALQTEGSGLEGGRKQSTWDYQIQDSKTPAIDIATDSYNRYTDDVDLLVNMGVDIYRFSISWSRILPEGTIDGGINEEGINFYNKFIDKLIAKGITPFVTLFHFDLPTTLDKNYNGFLSINIVEDFKAYADLCFKTFGDRVKHWATINEPQVWGPYGFSSPGPNANAITDPLLSAHHVILAHATAAKHYKTTYQPTQGGEIGIPLSVEWFEPFNDHFQDVDASRRAFDFSTGWFLEPLVYGRYPFIMRALLGDKLPEFKDDQKELVKGSYDYIGVNYYTSNFAKAIPISNDEVYTSYTQYMHAELTAIGPDGKPIGPPTPGSSQIYVYPEGLRKALIFLKNYENPKIYVTENGYPDLRDDTIPVKIALIDDARIQHIKDHLAAIKHARKTAGTNVMAYIMWALLDCMEVGSYYQVRFGLNYTDYLDNLKRIPKKSAGWLKDWLAASNST